MSKYVLIGIPNSGKISIGKRAAEILQIPFYNTNTLAMERIDEALDRPADIFTSFGQRLSIEKIAR